jgi:hypothetical protein
MNFSSLVDVAEENGRSVFLLKSPDDGRVSIKDSVELEDLIIQPPPFDLLPYSLPSAERVMAEFEHYSTNSVKELDEKLYDDLKVYLEKSAVLSNPDYYHLMTAWIFHTYLMEYFDYSPILQLLGQPATGKSRLGRALVHASYRGVHLESLAGSHMIRLASDHHASLFFDVKNLGQKVSRAQTLDHLLLRGERGAIVPRVTSPGKGAFQDMSFFTTFGPTIIATNESYDERAFESRTLCLRMPPLRRAFPKQVATQEVALPFRERLLAFRAWHLNEELPEFTSSCYDRLGDITDPIFQIIQMVKPEAKAYVFGTIDKLSEDALACRQDSPDIRILRVVCGLAEITRGDFLTVEEIRQHVNGVRDGLSVLSAESIGRRLTAFGFERFSTSDGTRAIRYNPSWLSSLLSRYGITFLPMVPLSRS